MAYTPTTWTTGDTITATAMNKIENGIAGAGNNAIVELSASGYGSATQVYGRLVYAKYDSTNSRWVVSQDDDSFWVTVLGFGNNAPTIIPPYLTVLPSDDNIGLFFVNANSNVTVSVTGNISSTTLYFNYGSVVMGSYRITGNGSITVHAS